MSRAIWIIIIFYFFNHVQTAEAQIFVDSVNNFTCPPSDYSQYTIHASFFSQASMIISYGGIIFNIVIYGVKSQFSSTTTFLLDDISIFALSFVPTISWYFICKPLYIAGYDQTTILISVSIIFLVLFLIATYLLVLYNWPCHHKYNSWMKGQREILFTKKSVYWTKYIIIHTYFIHSILIIGYDINSALETFMNHNLADFINFQFLNFTTDIIYFCLSAFLIIEFHQVKRYEKFVHKRIFFFTIFLSTIQILFEYALVCSPPYIDIIFNFVLTTILTRSTASYFSKREETAEVNGIKVSLIHGKNNDDEKDPNLIKKYRGIRLIVYSENVKKEAELYGAKVTIIDKDMTDSNVTNDDEKPNDIKVTLVYKKIEGDNIKESELDITGKIIKLKITEGFGFLNYVIYAHRKFENEDSILF